MVTLNVTYDDLDDNPRSEKLYFNLTESEFAEWELETEGGLAAFLDSIDVVNHPIDAYRFISDLIVRAYGVRTDDSAEFKKSKKLAKKFKRSLAFDAVFQHLSSSADAQLDFIMGIMPKRLRDQMKPQLEEMKINSATDPTPELQ